MSERTEPSPGVPRGVPGARAGLFLMLTASVAVLLSDVIYRVVESSMRDETVTAEQYQRLSTLFLPFDFGIFLVSCVGLALLARVPKTTGLAIGAIVAGIAAWFVRGTSVILALLSPSTAHSWITWTAIPLYLLGAGAMCLLVASLQRAAKTLRSNFPLPIAALAYSLIAVGMIIALGGRLMLMADEPNIDLFKTIGTVNTVIYYVRQLLVAAGMIVMLVSQPQRPRFGEQAR